jgi:hypothetical protein
MILKMFKDILRFVLRISRTFRRFSLFGASNEEWKKYAKNLREIARQYGLDNHFPVILSEPERCTSCNALQSVLMQPHVICGECWSARLEATIERDSNQS